jgi:hypothetical protein
MKSKKESSKVTYLTESEKLQLGRLPMFKIYKKGMTDFPITIISKNWDEYNNQQKNREFKIYLGYTIIELN